MSADCSRAALARVGRAGSFFGFLGCFDLSGDFAIRSNMGRVRGRGKVGPAAVRAPFPGWPSRAGTRYMTSVRVNESPGGLVV